MLKQTQCKNGFEIDFKFRNYFQLCLHRH